MPARLCARREIVQGVKSCIVDGSDSPGECAGAQTPGIENDQPETHGYRVGLSGSGLVRSSMYCLEPRLHQLGP